MAKHMFSQKAGTIIKQYQILETHSEINEIQALGGMKYLTERLEYI